MERGPAPAGQVVSRVGVMGLPIGFRFQPTDEELVLHYLRRKAFSCPLPADIIPVIDLAKYDPWNLPAGEGEGAGERYFFYLPEVKHYYYSKGGRLNCRATSSGFWKSAGKEKAVVTSRCKRPVGVKRTLVFHRGKPPHAGSRTDWVMHEYRLAGFDDARKNASHMSSCMAQAKNWVVCRIFKKNQQGRKDGGQGLLHRNRFSFIPETIMPSSPSSSCITEASDDGEESCSSVASSNSP